MRPNFSSSHTFSLTSLRCPLKCYFQSETKIEPDLGLISIRVQQRVEPSKLVICDFMGFDPVMNAEFFLGGEVTSI